MVNEKLQSKTSPQLLDLGENIKAEVPKILYHYCSIDTFKEIIKNKTIRLSDIFKTNDSSEVIHVLKFLPALLNEEYVKNPFPFKYKGIDNEKAFDLIVSDINKNINDVKFSSYIACFSKLEDDLEQWNRYGDDGKGVAIGYDGKILYDIAKKCSGVKITEVSYDEKKQKEYVRFAIVPQIFDAIKKAGDNGNVKNGFCTCDDMIQIHINSSIPAILLFAIEYKDKAYKCENEWRLYLNTPEKTEIWYFEGIKKYSENEEQYGDIVRKKMSFINKSNNGESSYIDLYLGEYKNASKIIKKIIIGPKFKIRKRDLNLKKMLHAINFDMGLHCVAHSEIQQSKISCIQYLFRHQHFMCQKALSK